MQFCFILWWLSHKREFNLLVLFNLLVIWLMARNHNSCLWNNQTKTLTISLIEEIFIQVFLNHFVTTYFSPYLLHNPTVEQVTINWIIFIFHWQYWIIVREYCSILCNNIKQMHTAGFNYFGNVIIWVFWGNWSQNTLQPCITGLKELWAKWCYTIITIQDNGLLNYSDNCNNSY